MKKIVAQNTGGKLLEIGARTSPYKKYMTFTSYSLLDIKNTSGDVDYVQDLHNTTLPSSSFDTIIMTEVLEHLYNPWKAMEQVRRICKPGGTVIASTRFAYQYHGIPYDYYRFTIYGIKEIFREFKEVEIVTHGNRILILWEILTSYKLLEPLRILNPIVCFLFDSRKKVSANPLGFIIVAKK